MSDFSQIEKLYVPHSLLKEGQQFLRKAGASGCEGMVLWVGRPENTVFEVTDLLIPRQHGIRTKDGVCVVVDADEMHRINVSLFKAKLRLIAQVHSHPTHAYHSDTDDEYALATTTGSFSLVVPDFAVRPFDLAECATYRLMQDGSWQEVPLSQVRSTILIKDE